MKKLRTGPRFVDCVCPDCDEFFKGEFVPCGLNESWVDQKAEKRLLRKYVGLVKDGKLTPINQPPSGQV